MPALIVGERPIGALQSERDVRRLSVKVRALALIRPG
jgi:hypothetical protein